MTLVHFPFYLAGNIRSRAQPFTSTEILPKKMQFTGNRARKRSKIHQLEGSQITGRYVHGLQMYKVPPTDNITLEEFEEFAIDRLKGKLKLRLILGIVKEMRLNSLRFANNL